MPNGILLIDKEEGYTSRDVDNKVQRLFHTRKVGHLGTLDPFATGLLIVSVERGCKFLPFMEDGDKTYVATLKLGYSSSTGDKTGEITEGTKPTGLTEAIIKETFARFIGVQDQIPPMTSAIKVDGKALYKLAHKGEEIERKPRQINVISLDLLGFSDESIEFRCKVSKGTYVRVLGEDIAKALGTVGYLTSLRRTHIGPFSVDDAKKIDQASETDLRNPVDFVYTMDHFEPEGELLRKIDNGMTVDIEGVGDKVLLTQNGEAIAVYEKREDGHYHSLRGLR